MEIRYCTCWLQRIYPCQNGWGDSSEKSCFADPMKNNCKNIVDTLVMSCPFCRANLANAFSQAECIRKNKNL